MDAPTIRMVGKLPRCRVFETITYHVGGSRGPVEGRGTELSNQNVPIVVKEHWSPTDRDPLTLLVLGESLLPIPIEDSRDANFCLYGDRGPTFRLHQYAPTERGNIAGCKPQ